MNRKTQSCKQFELRDRMTDKTDRDVNSSYINTENHQYKETIAIYKL
jgi:hypothetical protein